MAVILTATRIGTPSPGSWGLDDDFLSVTEPRFDERPSIARTERTGARPLATVLGNQPMRLRLSGHYMVDDALGFTRLRVPKLWQRAGYRFALSGVLLNNFAPLDTTAEWIFASVEQRGTAMMGGAATAVLWEIVIESAN